jgi:hypothetical protein
VATRSGPIVIQFVFGVVFIAAWLLEKWSSVALDTGGGIFIAMAIAAAVAAAVAGVLLTRASSTARGIGLSVGASAVIVLIGGAVLVYILY